MIHALYDRGTAGKNFRAHVTNGSFLDPKEIFGGPLWVRRVEDRLAVEKVAMDICLVSDKTEAKSAAVVSSARTRIEKEYAFPAEHGAPCFHSVNLRRHLPIITTAGRPLWDKVRFASWPCYDPDREWTATPQCVRPAAFPIHFGSRRPRPPTTRLMTIVAALDRPNAPRTMPSGPSSSSPHRRRCGDHHILSASKFGTYQRLPGHPVPGVRVENGVDDGPPTVSPRKQCGPNHAIFVA
jgi:hypothetical protein